MLTNVNSNSFFRENQTTENKKPQISPSAYALFNIVSCPTITICGQLLLSTLGQTPLLVSAPPLFILACHAAAAAIILAPLLYLASYLINYCLPEQNLWRRLSYIVCHFLAVVLDMEVTAALAALSGYKLMTIYSLYAIYGTGFLTVALAVVGLLLLAHALDCFATTDKLDIEIDQNIKLN